MRLLTEGEIDIADKFTDEAYKVAIESPCQKSKRGIIIVRGEKILGRGFNHPPRGLSCQPDECYDICNQYTVHAEEDAIIKVLRKGIDPVGARMYHVKVKEGEVKITNGPSCPRCSVLVLDVGIREFVLQQEEGYVLYNTKEFQELSLRSLK